MITISGQYNSAKVFTDNIEQEAISQVIELLNQPFVEGRTVRIMPDTHAGAGCVIGFTADMGDMVIPNLVGVDIGCGMFVVSLGKLDLPLPEVDKIIHDNVPAGKNAHENPVIGFSPIKEILCFDTLKHTGNFERSIGTLGGGNHFIELDRDDDNNVYLVIHSGSRNLGKQVADVYQKIAVDTWKIGGLDYKEHRQKLIDNCRAEKRGYDIPGVLERFDKTFRESHPQYPADLCFLFGDKLKNYLHDMKICQAYASLNRQTIAKIVLDKLGLDLSKQDSFETIHNYVNFEDNIIRKGAVSAYGGERLIIPINMRDGSLLCVGKGNPDWNFSAPHGAGRLMSRSGAKRTLSLEVFEREMRGIYTTTANYSTLDESPQAYKPMDEIISNIADTVEIEKVIKPIYNFKADE
jgi:tRNA-splicing ligase RtcB